MIRIDGVVAENEACKTTFAGLHAHSLPRTRDNNLLNLSKGFKKCFDSLTSDISTTERGVYSLINLSLFLGNIQGPIDSSAFDTDDPSIQRGLLRALKGVGGFLSGGILNETKGTIGPVFENFDVQ